MIKPIYDERCPGYYVDELGNVYSDKNGQLRVLKPTVHRGYLHVEIRENTHPVLVHKVPVHRLIISTFDGERPEGMECRHLNGNALDNRLCNLKWGTHSENMQDEIRHGTAHCLLHGENSSSAKLSNQQVKEIRELGKTNISRERLAERYGVSSRHIRDILNWKTRCKDNQI